MLSKDVLPTTLVGIKRLARQLASSHAETQHAGRLDRAAQLAGFQNFRHAQAQLLGPALPDRRAAEVPKLASTFITAYWSDLSTGGSGRETIEIVQPRPWRQLVEPRSFRYARGLQNFRGQADDHLVARTVLGDDLQARKYVCAAARTLAFMGSTGLKPGGAPVGIAGGPARESLPKADHASRWLSVAGDFVVYVDEPYEASVMGALAAREAWALRHGFCTVRVNWSGMYYPDLGAAMFLVAKVEHREQLEKWAAALSQLPPPPMASAWNGESAAYAPLFLSPSEIARGARPRRPPDLRMRRSTSASQPYAGLGSGRRANGRMPVPMHEEVGCLLREVIGGASGRSGIANRLDAIRLELDEWVRREYSLAEVDLERLEATYLGDIEYRYSRSIPEADKLRYPEHLERIQTALRQHYPVSRPLQQLLHRLELARKSLLAWKA
jgi:hypothetical protein